MRFAAVVEIVGQFVDLPEGRGQVIGTDGWGSGSSCYARIRLADGSLTCRQTAHILPLLSTTRSAAMPTAAAEKPAKTPPVKKAAARKAKKPSPSWKELPAAEKAAYLLERTTIPDTVHTTEKRLPKESRSDFIRRIYGVEEAASS